MRKIGTFFDIESGMDYDLYTMNAVKLKEALTKSYPLTPLKINMFNDGTNTLQNLETEVVYGGLEVDFEKGEVLNIEEYLKNVDGRYRSDEIEQSIKNTHSEKIETSNYHQIGFELLPLAISLRDRNVENLEELELIDGFKRMFWTPDIPDRDVFVKVYDTMNNKQWANAMLLYNSWKIPLGAGTFIDRGFKLGLYRHFGLDLSINDRDSLSLITKYLSKSPYEVLKNNEYFIDDMFLLINLYETFMNSRRISKEKKSPFGFIQYLETFATLLGKLRRLEFFLSKRENALKISEISIKDFFTSATMKKHIAKINSMSVPGRVDNYIEKYMVPLTIEHLRNIYGLKGDISNYFEYPANYYFTNLKYFFVPCEQLESMFVKAKEIAEQKKNRPLSEMLF